MNNYVLIYSQSRNPIFDIERDIKSFGFSAERINAGKLKILNYLNNEFVLEFFSNGKEINETSENNEEEIKQSELSEQFIKISSIKEDIRAINGLSNLIILILRDKLRKPIYHFNKYDDIEFLELKTNYDQQIFNRLKISEYIEEKPSKIPDSEIRLAESCIGVFQYEEVIAEKRSTNNPLKIWYSIGEIIGLDGWDMTASNFTPITINVLKNDINEINYPEELKKLILKNQVKPKTILRINKNIQRGECSYLIEEEDKLIFKEVTSMF